jgi:predicted site-specific integrase-resolvase
MKSEFVGVTEAADLLGVSVKSVHRYIERGYLTPVHKNPGLRGAVILRRRDVEKLETTLEEYTVKGPPRNREHVA